MRSRYRVLLRVHSVPQLIPEGDFGKETLQEVAATLADALREQPVPMNGNEPAFPYVELATLVRYEHVQAALRQEARQIRRKRGERQVRKDVT